VIRLAQAAAGRMAARPLLGRASLLALAPVAAALGSPRVAARARRLAAEGTGPDSCGEFCAPATPCHGGCGCPPSQPNCFVCNGCGDLNAIKCFSHSCASGFCWKVTC